MFIAFPLLFFWLLPFMATVHSDAMHPSQELPEAIAKIEKDMVRVKGGLFTMGCTAEQGDDCEPNEYPAIEVEVGSFSICKFELSQYQWELVMGTCIEDQKSMAPGFYQHNGGVGPNHPMQFISREEAGEFVRRLSEITGKAYRLPTEAEWEFAARGGLKSKGYKYAGGNDIGEVAWYDGNTDDVSQPIGRKKPNELGLYDMSGNVYEWCADPYQEYGQQHPKKFKLIKGGDSITEYHAEEEASPT